MKLRASHVGLCVSDLAASLRFWRDGLGFETTFEFAVGDEFAAALEVVGEPGEPVAVTSHLLTRDGLTVELLAYRSPAPSGRPSTSRGQLGLTHLCFLVDDVAAVAAHLVAHGGTVVEPTRTSGPTGDYLFVADPDGTRVELMRVPGMAP